MFPTFRYVSNIFSSKIRPTLLLGEDLPLFTKTPPSLNPLHPPPPPHAGVTFLFGGPRSQRGPLVKGRILCIEAIQTLKRLHRTNPPNLTDALSTTLTRLIKSDLVATLRDLIFRTGLEGPGLTVAQKIWYCVATVGGQFFWARLQSFSALRRWGDTEQRPLARRLWILIQRMEGIYKAASFGNLLIFLFTGRYRNLIERALRARLVYVSPNMNRSVSFEYMNRQLVWNEFSVILCRALIFVCIVFHLLLRSLGSVLLPEMLLLLLPLLNSSSVKNLLQPFSKDKSSSSAEDGTLCPICQASPTIPFVALPCQHRYCYYCLRTRCAAAPSFRCSRCSEPVVAMQRHGGVST